MTSLTFDAEYRDLLRTLSEGSVRRHFDPYADIDWDSPEFQLDAEDPRWELSSELDPLGGTAWYQALPQDQRIELGRWRTANAIRVGAAFESILIRGVMQYIFELPNQSPEFRYCLHEMTEECNHIQMFQELVNRIGVDVPGMRPLFKVVSPYIGLLGAYVPLILFIGILGGEEPIDHYQKSVIRMGSDIPEAVLKTMEIHIAEEARHISFANDFLRVHMAEVGPLSRAVCSVVFPLTMRWLGGEIMTLPTSIAKKFDIPKEVMKEAFWSSAHSQRILAGYFGDMRKLATDLGLMNPISRWLWTKLGVDGPTSRYRGEHKREAERIA